MYMIYNDHKMGPEHLWKLVMKLHKSTYSNFFQTKIMFTVIWAIRDRLSKPTVLQWQLIIDVLFRREAQTV